MTCLHCCFPEVLAVRNILADVSARSDPLDDVVFFKSRCNPIVCKTDCLYGEKIFVSACNHCGRSASCCVTTSMLRLRNVLACFHVRQDRWLHDRIRFCQVAHWRDIAEDCLARTHTRARGTAHKHSMHDTHARHTHPHTIRWCRCRELTAASSLGTRNV